MPLIEKALNRIDFHCLLNEKFLLFTIFFLCVNLCELCAYVVREYKPNNYYNRPKERLTKNLEFKVQQNFANTTKFLEVMA
jgi:hypothetical protein